MNSVMNAVINADEVSRGGGQMVDLTGQNAVLVGGVAIAFAFLVFALLVILFYMSRMDSKGDNKPKEQDNL